nr:hypothetical protein [Neisseria meningitidis]
MPTPPAALMVAPVRPNPPKDGKTATLLEHAAEFGGYVAELENQNQAWRDWAGNHSRKVGNCKKARVGRGAEGESGFYTSFTGVAAVVLFSKSTAC